MRNLAYLTLAQMEHIEAEFSEPPRVRALLLHLNDGTEPEEIEEPGWDRTGNTLKIGRAEYLVLTEDEADDAAREYLIDMLDDVYEIPSAIRPYLDEDRWADDAIQIDGRGHTLAGYDGNEDEQEDPETGITFYIYRTG